MGIDEGQHREKRGAKYKNGKSYQVLRRKNRDEYLGGRETSLARGAVERTVAERTSKRGENRSPIRMLGNGPRGGAKKKRL